MQLRWNAEDKHEKIGTSLNRSVRAAESRASGAHSDDGGTVLDDLAGFQTSLPGFLAPLARGRIPGVDRFAFWTFSRRAIRNWKLPFKPREARRPCPSEFYFCRGRSRFSTLWHVIHRPFSYSFAILAILHIVVALGMGYR